jgi:hypothetical protein
MMLIHDIVPLSGVAGGMFLHWRVVTLSILLLRDMMKAPLYLGKFFVHLSEPVLPTAWPGLFALSCTSRRNGNYPIIMAIVGIVGKKNINSAKILPSKVHVSHRMRFVFDLRDENPRLSD